MTKAIGEDFYSTLELTELALGFVGMRAFNDDRKGIRQWIKRDLFFVVTIVQLSITVVCESIHLAQIFDEDFLGVADMITCIGFCLVGLSKMMAIYTDRRQLQKHFEELNALWPRDNLSNTVLDIKQRCTQRLYRLSAAFFGIYLVVIVLYNSNPLFGTMVDIAAGNECLLGLPYAIWTPFDPYAPIVYQAMYLNLMWSGNIAAIGIIAQECMFYVSCSHIAMLMEILHHDLLNIVPEDYVYCNADSNECAMLEKLNVIIERHQKLIELAEVLERTYNVVIMVNVVIQSFIICMVGFQLTVASTTERIKFGFSTIGGLTQAFILSWYGNLLIEKSESLRDAAYECRWYNTGPKFKRTLFIFLMRSQKKVCVTALKFFPLSLRTFTAIVSRSWSYFTLIRTMYNPN